MVVVVPKYIALHSILKIRFGAAPVTDVKTPFVPPSVRRSSQNGAIKLFIVAVGRQALVNAVLVLVNCKLPFELTLAELNSPP